MNERRDGAAADNPTVVCHAFIAGFPRSGTTLLESILAAHPDVITLAEKSTLGDVAPLYLSNESGLRQFKALSPADVRDARLRYWKRVREFGANPDGKVFVDENPLNSLWLALVAKLFPDAKVIFAVRDPRDVVFSCFRRRLQISLPTYEFLTLERAAQFYANTMRLAEAYRRTLALAWIDVRHESLVAEFETEAAGICAFLGLAYHGAMREFGERARTRAIPTASAPQIVRGLNSDGVGQWRHYANELRPVLPILAPWVERFGYPAD
jgi:hypothetical protein